MVFAYLSRHVQYSEDFCCFQKTIAVPKTRCLSFHECARSRARPPLACVCPRTVPSVSMLVDHVGPRTIQFRPTTKLFTHQ
eukprot:6225895-Prymnesium_polylepis.1